MTEEQRIKLKRLHASIHEPEHVETLCWCKPKFSNINGILHVDHNQQRNVICDFVEQNFL